jgi:DNA-binding IclR family transcriptional regulator
VPSETGYTRPHPVRDLHWERARAGGATSGRARPQPSAQSEKPQMKSLSTALQVLREFVAAQKPFGVVELSERLGLHKGQVSKILRAFREESFLEQDPKTRKYSVGLNAFALGNNFVNSNVLSREALPIMRRLVDATGHSGVLSVLHEASVIHLLAVEGRLFVDGRWRVGRWMPYHTTSSGRVLLAFSPEEALESRITRYGLSRLTPNSITDAKTLRTAIAKVRRQGYSVTRSETHVGTASLAVPLFGHDGRAMTALGLICPEHLLDQAEVKKLVPPLQAAARELSARMGAQVCPFGK